MTTLNEVMKAVDSYLCQIPQEEQDALECPTHAGAVAYEFLYANGVEATDEAVETIMFYIMDSVAETNAEWHAQEVL